MRKVGDMKMRLKLASNMTQEQLQSAQAFRRAWKLLMWGIGLLLVGVLPGWLWVAAGTVLIGTAVVHFGAVYMEDQRWT
jgi:hypothetical protein